MADQGENPMMVTKSESDKRKGSRHVTRKIPGLVVIQCTALNRQGTRCSRPVVPGATVCRLHGGAAPQVIAKAKERILAAAPQVADSLIKVAVNGKNEAARVSACRDVLDRAGVKGVEASFEVNQHSGLSVRLAGLPPDQLARILELASGTSSE